MIVVDFLEESIALGTGYGIEVRRRGEHTPEDWLRSQIYRRFPAGERHQWNSSMEGQNIRLLLPMIWRSMTKSEDQSINHVCGP